MQKQKCQQYLLPPNAYSSCACMMLAALPTEQKDAKLTLDYSVHGMVWVWHTRLWLLHVCHAEHWQPLAHTSKPWGRFMPKNDAGTMQAESANVPTVTTRFMRMMRLRIALRCMLHTSLNTSRFSAISCMDAPEISNLYLYVPFSCQYNQRQLYTVQLWKYTSAIGRSTVQYSAKQRRACQEWLKDSVV